MIDGADKIERYEADLTIAQFPLSMYENYPNLILCGNGVFQSMSPEGSGLARMFDEPRCILITHPISNYSGKPSDG